MSEQPMAFEEVPGSRTTQQAIDQPQRDRIAYEELRPGDVIQEGDEWQHECFRWKPFATLDGSRVQVRQGQRVRRPHNITMMLAEFATQAEVLAEVRADEEGLVSRLELLRSEYATVQNERDELKTALRESHAAHAFTTKQGLAACKERDEACRERDLARSEVARLSTELWARKPLEERVASLTEELAQAREASQQLLQTITDNADQFANAGKILERERDEARAELGVALTRVIALEHNLAETKKDAARIAQEYAEWSEESEAASSQLQQERDYARAERDRLQEVVDNLYNEPTAKQVQDMLRTWATELDWSTGCFGSFGRSQIDIIQQTMVAVIQRIETMLNPEGGTDGE